MAQSSKTIGNTWFGRPGPATTNYFIDFTTSFYSRVASIGIFQYKPEEFTQNCFSGCGVFQFPSDDNFINKIYQEIEKSLTYQIAEQRPSLQNIEGHRSRTDRVLVDGLSILEQTQASVSRIDTARSPSASLASPSLDSTPPNNQHRYY